MHLMEKWTIISKNWFLLLIMAIIILTLVQTGTAASYRTRRGEAMKHHRRRGWSTGAILGAVIDPITTTIVCSTTVDCNKHKDSGTPVNHSPTMTCPKDSNFEAPEGSDTAQVTWESFIAKDPEEGDIIPEPTPKITIGTPLPEGFHSITFKATDKAGASTTCSSWFNVTVHRCPVKFATTPIHGRHTCTIDNKGKDPVWGTECSYDCDRGYKLNGVDKVKCNDKGEWLDTAGQVVSKVPKCEDTKPTITCPHDQTVMAERGHSTAVVSWNLATAYDNEDGNLTVTTNSTLQSGEHFAEKSYDITFEAKDYLGGIATCSFRITVKVHRCPVKFASSPMHGSHSCSPDNQGLKPVWGTECSYDCDNGYKLVGVENVTCNDNGEWLDAGGKVVSEMPICNNTKPTITCPANQTVRADIGKSNAIVHWNDATAYDNEDGVLVAIPNSNLASGQSYPEGTYVIAFQTEDSLGGMDSCTFSFTVNVHRCSANYTRDLTHGSRLCTINSTGDPIWGTVCDYQCDPGYQLVGERQLTCQETEEWSNSAGHVVNDPPTCEAMSCQKPNFDSTGEMIYNCSNGYTMGETCFIHCKSGNPPHNSHSIICGNNATATPPHDMIWTFSGSSAPFCKVNQCPKLNPPKDGSLACDYQNGTGEVCVPSCNANVVRPPTMKDVYQCMDATLTWTPDNKVPDCFGRRNPALPIIVPDFYYYTNTCDPNSREIKEDFLKAFQKSFICASGCNDTSTIQITCYPNNVGKRDAATSSDWLLAISAEISLGPMIDQGNLTDTTKYYDEIAMKLNTDLQTESDAGLFNVPNIGPYGGFGTGMTQYKCEEGMVLDDRSLYCAGCGEGHYYESSDGSCQACPVGRYQDQEVAFQCTKCPGNTTTSSIRAKSVHECHEFCSNGTYSLSGFKPCDPCPRGSYQSELGATSCDLCPYGMSTESVGVTEKTGCQFFDIEMNSKTPGPWIQLFDKTPQTFTLVTWVHVTSGSQRTTLTFDIDENEAQPGSAYLALGGIKIFITATEDLTSRKIRNWYHLALVYDHGTADLFVDGSLKQSREKVSVSELWKETISFVSSDDLQSVVLSNLEMTNTALPLDILVPISYTCDKRVDNNILVVHEVDETLVNRSICNDHDDCTDDVCGHHGTCIDAYQGFTCLCDEEWDGPMCQQPLINITSSLDQ